LTSFEQSSESESLVSPARSRASTYRAEVADPGMSDLMGSTEVTQAVEHARSAVTALRRHPANRTGWPRTAAVASVRAARASAALDGAPMTLNPDSEIVTDPALAGALRVAAALGSMTTIWPRSPLQVLARLHTLAAADLVPVDELGRPRMAGQDVGARLARLAGLVTTSPWPAPVQVALVHGELLTLAPFGAADGVVARAAARLTMVSTGLDPAGLGVPEVAHLRSGPRYLDLAMGFSTGSPAAVVAWIAEVCRCLAVGAREGVSIADSAV
jgi:hypothetical protein